LPGKIIFFDFDKTLTNEDTLLPAAYFFLKYKKKSIRFPFIAASFIAFRMKLISEYRFKEILCEYMVKGLNEEKAYNIASSFFEFNASRQFFNPRIIEILKDYNTKGYKIYLVSSNFEFLLEPLKEILPVDGIYATTAKKHEKIYSGKISGEVCSFERKLTRTSHLLQNNQTVCYGDSEGDFALMNACNMSYLVKHNKKSIPGRIFHFFRLITGVPETSSASSFRIIPFKT